MSENKIKCPECGTLIDIDEALSHQAEERLNEKMRLKENELLAKEKEFEEKRNKANEEYKLKMDADRLRITKEETEKAQKDNQIQLQNLAQQIEKLNQQKQESEKRELEALNREKEIKEREENVQLIIAREVSEKTKDESERIKKSESEKHELEKKQLEKQLYDQKILIEEMKRKAEQGSMQLQGEVQELVIEQYLKEKFPLDEILEVAKGKRGADCIQIIHSRSKQHIGSIIYESKQTKAFSHEWIEKLNADKRLAKADIAVLVTSVYPKDMERMDMREGVWICSLEEFKGLCMVLREGIIKVNEAIASQENKGDKMVMLYDYLTSNEFNGQWKAISEGFLSMKLSIQRERDAMEKLWKAREKHLEKILLNTNSIRGSIEGIAGLDYINLNLLDSADELLLEE